MKIVLTGSLGHISKPLAKELVQKGHSVTVISNQTERQKDIEALGAKAAFGTMEDVSFLSSTFKSADIVYLMEAQPRTAFFDPNYDVITSIAKIGKNYKQAIEQSGVKKVVHLSSIGAHTNVGNGLLKFHYEVEKILNELPGNVSIKFMRPVGFYYNLLSFIPAIKTQGVIATNYGGDTKKPWVSTIDIAGVIAEEMEKPFEGRTIRYIASDEISCDEIATILGTTIGKPDLKWVVISSEQLLNGMKAIGMNPAVAKGLVEFQANKNLYEDYYLHRPVLSKTKLTDYAKEFAAAYNGNSGSSNH